MVQLSNFCSLLLILFAFYGVSEAVKCYNCDGDCPATNAPQCDGKYCYFVGSRIGNNNETGSSGCSDKIEIDYIANIPTNYTLGDCDNTEFAGITFFYKVCNDTDFCNTPCGASSTASSLVLVCIAAISTFVFGSL